MRFEVRGIPAPQGSKRHVGHGIMIESSKKVRPWRDAVRYAAIEARGGADPLDGPLIASMVFTLTRPRSHYRSVASGLFLKSTAPSQPCSQPDLSKLIRSTEDALKEARVIEDDARIVEYSRAAKVYEREDPDALDSPGVVIEIRRVV